MRYVYHYIHVAAYEHVADLNYIKNKPHNKPHETYYFEY